MALRVGESPDSPTREGPDYGTEDSYAVDATMENMATIGNVKVH